MRVCSGLWRRERLLGAHARSRSKSTSRKGPAASRHYWRHCTFCAAIKLLPSHWPVSPLCERCRASWPSYRAVGLTLWSSAQT